VNERIPDIGESDAPPPCLDVLVSEAEAAANFLKALGHDGRMTILCHLVSGPKSVTELENLALSRQAIVSQQLARLRLEGLVSARREGQAIYYSLRDPKVEPILRLLCALLTETKGAAL
jgi:DNA-binding transcriptional ArsR family regulator